MTYAFSEENIITVLYFLSSVPLVASAVSIAIISLRVWRVHAEDRGTASLKILGSVILIFTVIIAASDLFLFGGGVLLAVVAQAVPRTRRLFTRAFVGGLLLGCIMVLLGDALMTISIMGGVIPYDCA